MNDQELITKIKLLKDIKPAEEWALSCRVKLAFRMEMSRKSDILKRDAYTLGQLFSFWANPGKQRSFNLVYSLIIAVMVVLGGGGLTVWAATQSMPGNPLYPVKIAIEKAQLSTSLSDESRFQFQAQLADKRLWEINEVVNSQDSAEQKAEKISQVAETIQNQLNTVNSQLVKPKIKAADPQKGLETVKIVSDKADQVSKALGVAKESLPAEVQPILNSKLAEVTKAANQTNISVLESLIVNQQNLNATTTAEIAIKIAEQIDRTEAQVKAKEQELADKSVADKLIADKLPIRAVLINQFQQSLDLLDEARALLAENDLLGSLEMLKAAKTINNGAEQMAAQEQENKPEIQDDDSPVGDNSTTTVEAVEYEGY